MSSITDLITHRSQSSLMMGAGSVFAGTACAALRGNSEYLPMILCLLFAAFIQLASNFKYLYHDASRGSGFMVDKQSKQIPPALLKEFSFGTLMLASMVGLALCTLGGWWVFAVGTFILIMFWLSSGGTFSLLRTPYGPVSSFILFGPVCVISTSFGQSLHETTDPHSWFNLAPAVYMSIVMGLMCVNSTLLYGYSTHLADIRSSNHSFVTRFGRGTTRTVFLSCSLLSAAFFTILCVSLDPDLFVVDMIPAVICTGINLYIWRKMRTMPRRRLHELVHIGNLNVLIMGLLSLLIFEATGLPDCGDMQFFGA